MKSVALMSGTMQVRKLGAVAGLAMMMALTGCGAFFQCEGKTSCGTSGGGTSTGTGDYVYVSNSSQGNGYIDGYTVGTSALTEITGFPLNLGYVPVAMKVSPSNNYLYVVAAAGASNPGLYVYPITSTGALSSGTQLITNTEIDALDISPDGKFIFTLTPEITSEVLNEYALNTSTGGITGSGATSFPLAAPNCTLLPNAVPVSQACSVAVSPSGTFVGVSMGGNGTAIFPYSSSAGATTQTGTILEPNSTTGDYSLAFDGSGFGYIARTDELSVYNSLSSTNPSNTTNVTYTSTQVPRSVTLSPSYNYLFTANEGTSNISMFTLSGGVPTQISASPVVGPTNVSALGVDRSGTYLLAAGYDTSGGLKMFSISSTGLTSVTTAGTGASTSIPVVMALTHP